MSGTTMRRLLRALVLAGALAQASPAAAMARQDIEATLAAAITQLVDQYVDPLDSRALTASGLRALAALPEAAAPSRQTGIDQALRASKQVKDIAPQARMLADEILRFDDGGPRETALHAALQGMMADLDTYSRFAAPAEVAPPPASVGLDLSIRDGALTVVRPLPGSPGERAGIRAGDIVTHVDGRATRGLPLPEAVALLRGPPGTRPTLTLQRPGTASPINAQPVRGPVQPPSLVRWQRDGAVAVIRISGFDSRTGDQLKNAVDETTAQATSPLAGLVMDLRGNAGGLLDMAEQVAGLALPQGSKIGTLRGRGPADSRALRARVPLLPHNVTMVVLVDQRTAAGAEIVAAALQDHGRALLIGAKTPGAGTIQTVLSLPADQGALLTTTHRVYRASGAGLDMAGVTPDMLLDEATRRVTVRDDIAADFNGVLAQRVRDAIAGAPEGADLALVAGRAALMDVK